MCVSFELWLWCRDYMDMQVISLDLKPVIITIHNPDMRKVTDTVMFKDITPMWMQKEKRLPYITSRIRMDFTDLMIRQMRRRSTAITKNCITRNITGKEQKQPRNSSKSVDKGWPWLRDKQWSHNFQIQFTTFQYCSQLSNPVFNFQIQFTTFKYCSQLSNTVHNFPILFAVFYDFKEKEGKFKVWKLFTEMDSNAHWVWLNRHKEQLMCFSLSNNKIGMKYYLKKSNMFPIFFLSVFLSSLSVSLLVQFSSFIQSSISFIFFLFQSLLPLDWNKKKFLGKVENGYSFEGKKLWNRKRGKKEDVGKDEREKERK